MQQRKNDHLEKDEIEAYSIGHIAETACARVEEHLLICELCRERVQSFDAYKSSMRMAARQVELDSGQRASWFPRLVRWTPLPASLALAATASLIIYTRPPRVTVQEPEVIVSLATARGPLSAQAPAGQPLDLEMDRTGLPNLPSYQVEIVNHTGTRVWQVQNASAAHVRYLTSGTYFVRLYTPSGELLREYGLEVVNP